MMEESRMKNMIILKDLPSNIVDEAFVILKQNKKIKLEDYAKNVQKEDKQPTTKYGARDYMVREAEMIIDNYLSNIENEKKGNKQIINRLEKKYKRLKILTYMLGAMLLLNGMIIIF